jgi:hypothetical protein
MTEYELEAMAELESECECEGELESELEGEAESEEFFGRLAGLARRAIQSPALRRVGLAAARGALRGLGDVGGAIGGAISPSATGVGRRLGSQLGGYLQSRLPQREYEGEFEEEIEGEMNPLRRVYPDALMEHMGHAAAEAESEAEAEAFIGALIPMATSLLPRLLPAAARLAPRVLPQAANVMRRVAPQLVRGVAGVTRALRRSPTTRPLVRAIPTVVRRTAANIAQQVARGQPVTAQGAVRTLARQTARVIGSPQQSAAAWQRSRALDRRYHQAAGGMRRRRGTACSC